MAGIKDTIAKHAGTANTYLTTQATNLATKATAAAGKPGILGKLAGWAATGLSKFASFTPWGKAATIGVAAIVGNKVLFGGSSAQQHPGQRYV